MGGWGWGMRVRSLQFCNKAT